MATRRVALLCLFIAADAVINLLSLGFFSPSFHFNIDLIPHHLLLLDGYNFIKSPFDFLVFFLIRLLGLIIASLLIAFNRDAWVKACNLPCLGFSIFTFSFTIIKLLAFAEIDEQLRIYGLWFLIAWSFTAASLFCLLWYFSLSNATVDYVRFFNADESSPDGEVTSTVENGAEENGSTTDEKKDRMSTWQHIKKLVAYCFVQWRWLLAGFIFLLAYSTVRIFIPYYTGVVIGNIVHARGYGPLFFSAGIMTLLTIFSAIFGGLRGGCFQYANSLIARRVRLDLFRSLVEQEIAFFDGTKTGEIVSRLTADCQTISDTVATNSNVFLRSAMMLAGALCFMFFLSWRLTLVSFIAIPLVIYVTKVYGRIFDRLYERRQTSLAEANQTAEEVLSTMRTVRSFACEKKEAARFEEMLDKTLAIARSTSISYFGYTAVNEFANQAILVAVLLYGGHLVITARMTSDAFISFLIYQMQLGDHLYNMGYVMTGLMQSVGASRKVFEYMNREPKIPNDGGARPLVQGELKMKSVSFTYPARPTNPVLKGLNLHIKAGETVALVGPSGGGKSSIVSLFEHFYEPDDGEITLDALPIAHYDHVYYHQKIALVAQEPVLYDGSVKANISYGCDWATEEDIIEAAKTANAHNFVMELEKGYDTNCGEKGVQMSGGQKQRIAIARALIRRPAVLVLDEATSALDSESEHLVQEAINRCARERTVLIIAHRLSTIEKADRIAVINKGVVVQMGSHAELMKDEQGLYHCLVSRQISGF